MEIEETEKKTSTKKTSKASGKKKKEPEGQMNLLSILEEKPSDEGEFLTSYIADYRRIQEYGE